MGWTPEATVFWHFKGK